MLLLYRCIHLLLTRASPMDDTFSEDELLFMTSQCETLPFEEVDIDELLKEGLDLSPVRESPDGCSVCDDSREEPVGREGSYLNHNENVCCYSDSEVEPELYCFEDFESAEDNIEPHLQIYDFINDMCQPNSRNNGKELLRSRTLPTIPVSQTLHTNDFSSEHSADWWKNKKTTDVVHPNIKGRDERSVVRWCSREDCYSVRSSTSSERRSRGRMLPRVPSSVGVRSTAWTLGGTGDGTDSPFSINTLDVPQPVARVPQFYYTTPPKSQMASTSNTEDKRLERRGSAKNSSFSRLARRLSQKERRSDREDRKVALRQRSVSLDCGEGRRSLLSPSGEECREGKASSIPPSPSMPSRLTSKGSHSGSTSPNIGRLSRRSSGGKRKSSSDLLDGGSMKADRKKAERKNYEIQALFDSVENQDMDMVKVILQTNGLDVNSINDEDLTPLDIAVLTNHIPMARLLLSHGAKGNPKFDAGEPVERHLLELIDDVHRHVCDLRGQLDAFSAGNTVGGVAGQSKESERLLGHLEFRHRLLQRMKAGYDHARIPDAPTNVSLLVASSSSLLLSFSEPDQHNGAVVTRYKVEWSCYEDFSPLAGEAIVDDLRQLHYEIPGLVQGNIYYARVSAWNIKGYGSPQVASPPYAIPSSWRELDNSQPRAKGKLKLLDELFTNLKNYRPPDAATIKDSHTPSGSPLHQRKSNMRKSIKNLFTSAPKFQKNLKRGVYLASLLYSEDRILVTSEDNLPVIEVDESFSGANLHSDFHWMMKVASTWEDVKSLKQDMDKSSSSGMVLLRSKLLHAANQLQSSLGMQDLGQFFYKPIKDMQGTIVLIAINSIKDLKSVSSTALKWLPISKLQKRLSPPPDNPAASELLLSSISEMIHYHQTSQVPLEKGLYLGYLKLKSSVDLIRVLVPEKTPNVLPFVKIRDCPNVSRDEWQWLQNLSVNDVKTPPTGIQLNFQNGLVNACKALLQDLGISEDEAVSHRVYDIEVVELSRDVSFLLLLPPAESVCSVPGHIEEMTERAGHLTLPVQVFEMIHMYTYQYDFICRYSRLSSILEMDSHLAQQSCREAFSSEEMSAAKERVDQLSRFQQSLDEAWKGMRWTMDIITYARDKNIKGGIPLGVLYAPPSSPDASPNVERRDVDISSTNSDMGYHSDRSSGDHSDGYQSNQHSKHLKFIGRHRKISADRASDGDSDSLLSVQSATCQPGILRVYAAYETGLAKGTSVKLHVTPRTTSREVINLVVQQLNKAVLTKGLNAPVYADEQLEEFCLVAVIGARERVLRDDYQPLQLQNPWTKGRLYVRLRNNLLAALEQGHVTAV